jgi:hypothetical protein
MEVIVGLDGLSLNNLGLNRNNTSKEESIEADRKSQIVTSGDGTIDQLGKKSEIQGGDHENTSASGGFSESLTEDEDTYEGAEDSEEEIYDEYVFEMIDNEKIRVIDGETNKEVAIIDAIDLSKFVSNLKQVSGIIVNREV